MNCTKCDYSTNANCKLNDHIKRCSLDGEIHKCQDCGYRSGTSYGLSKHRNKAHRMSILSAFKCIKCDYSTDSNGKLNEHLKRCSLDGEIHKCQECGYKSGTAYGLGKHRNKGKYNFLLKLCPIFVKGQLISKCLFAVTKLTKKPTKFL